MNIFLVNKDSAVPLYLQIYDHMRQEILQGNLLPGTKLPPSRQLAKQCGVARLTVTEAYAQLKAEGFITSRSGSGTYVSDSLPIHSRVLPKHKMDATHPPLSAWGNRVMGMRQRVERPVPQRPSIDFGFGRAFHHIFPYDVWRKLLARYLSTDDAMLARYGSVAGFYPLREALAHYLGRLRGVDCQPEQVVIVSGAQQALDILARLLLEPGDEVLLETPGYMDAFAIFNVYGTQIESLPVDDEGFPVEKIPTTSRAKLLFVTPSNQFPSGGTMPLARRMALLQWAQKHRAIIIEDDYDGELRYDGRPLSALQGLDKDGRVIYLGTFSKVLFPALRLGYVVLPHSLVTPFVQAKRLVDRGAPTLTQAAISDFINEGHFERHLRHLRTAYGQRHAVLMKALQSHMPKSVHYSTTPAGLHVMLFLPMGVEETAVIQQAAQAGVGVYPGARYHLQHPAPPSILMGFSGLSEVDIEEGVRRLAKVLQNGGK
ncbi:MAG: PLP-dependent aminotransferase family protein [Chloroflexi bacterium]|nr:MAG: PLP-dependent aminotransferase family protein [Chloroflexota bacterium]